MKTEILRIRIETELKRQLGKLAKSNALSLSSQVRMLVKKALDNAK